MKESGEHLKVPRNSRVARHIPRCTRISGMEPVLFTHLNSQLLHLLPALTLGIKIPISLWPLLLYQKSPVVSYRSVFKPNLASRARPIL